MVVKIYNPLRKCLHLVIPVLCLVGSIVSNPHTVEAQDWHCPWRTFTTADGLASGTVTAIFQAQDGTLWFGTTQGLSRYNGEWESYTTVDGLVHNEVTAISQDQMGSIWIGTRAGLSRYDGEWQTIDQSDGLVGQDVSMIDQFSDGTLWLATLDGGISYLKDEAWYALTYTEEGDPGGRDVSTDSITTAAQGNQGDIWVGTPLGLSHYDSDGWEVFTTAEGIPDNMITSILVATDGTVWVGTLGGLGYLRPGQSNDSWQILSPEDGLAGEHVNALIQDSEGVVWVGTTEGISFQDSQEWHTWTQSDGLASNDVRAIYEDTDGGLWFGTSAGVSYCDTTWRVYSLPLEEEDTVTYDISALAQSRDGALWIATLGGGVIRYQEGHWDTYTSAHGLADDNVFSLVEDSQGAIWVGTAGGISRYLAGEWETYHEVLNLPVNVVLSVAAASDDSLWFGTAGGGVVRYQAGEGGRIFAQSDGLADNYIRAVCEARDGTVWAGTTKGAARFDGQTWQTFTKQSTEGGLPGDEVQHIECAPDGSLWFATDKGAASFDGSSWRSYGRGDGLPADNVSTVWKEGAAIWFGTSGGLYRYDGQTWQVYTPYHGLPNSHVLSILRTVDTWWIGTTGGGLVRYRPEQSPPWARVMSVNDNPVVTSTVTLSAEAKNVVLAFTGGDAHTASQQLLYMHRLDGISEGWTFSPDRFALYSGLMPGTYTLLLKARDVNFNYSELYTLDIVIPTNLYGSLVVPSGPPEAMLIPSTSMPDTSGLALTQPTSVPDNLVAPPDSVAQELNPVVPKPSVSMSVPPQSTAPERDFTLWYGLLGLPLVAALGMGYWGYGHWRSRQAAGRDFNPYICGPPVHDERMFFGREAVVREILQIIHNNNIIIYGERRIGKTTLLFQLGQRLKRLDDPDYTFFPAFINLQGIPEDRLFLLLAQSLAQQLEDEVGSLGLICRSAGREERSSFASFSPSWQSRRTNYSNFDLQEDLDTIVHALQGTTDRDVRLILLVDEADVINTYDQAVQEQLRGMLMSSLAQHIKMILAGTYISKEWHLQSSPWYNLFSREIMLPPFDEEAVERLIQQPVEGIYRYEPEAVKQIIAYSDRKPFEAQQLCLHAVRETLARKKRHVTTSEVEAAVQSSLEERDLEFEQLWETMSPDGQRALRVLMKSTPRAIPGEARGDGREALSRLPLSDEDRTMLILGGVLYRYEKRERLLTSFQEWIRRESP